MICFPRGDPRKPRKEVFCPGFETLRLVPTNGILFEAVRTHCRFIIIVMIVMIMVFITISMIIIIIRVVLDHTKLVVIVICSSLGVIQSCFHGYRRNTRSVGSTPSIQTLKVDTRRRSHRTSVVACRRSS